MGNRQIFLKTSPQGKVQATDFDIRIHACPIPEPGQVLMRVLSLSLDPILEFILNNEAR